MQLPEGDYKKDRMAISRQSFRKVSFSAVHTTTPLDFFTLETVFGDQKHCFSVDGRTTSRKKLCVFKFMQISMHVDGALIYLGKWVNFPAYLTFATENYREMFVLCSLLMNVQV